MMLSIAVATLILQKKFTYKEIPEGVLKDNVKLILTTWGFPQLCED